MKTINVTIYQAGHDSKSFAGEYSSAAAFIFVLGKQIDQAHKFVFILDSGQAFVVTRDLAEVWASIDRASGKISLNCFTELDAACSFMEEITGFAFSSLSTSHG